MSEDYRQRSITPVVWYDDPNAALKWLEKAFGFETRMVVADDSGGVIHSECVLGDGYVMVVGPPREGRTSPASNGGLSSQSIHVHLPDDIDAHYARAKAAGATITRDIADQAYGDRVYICDDLEGHSWSFGQTLKAMTSEEMAQATGRKITSSAGAD
ncbi:MAG: VOC family protein [Caulobacterales bacterium]